MQCIVFQWPWYLLEWRPRDGGKVISCVGDATHQRWILPRNEEYYLPFSFQRQPHKITTAALTPGPLPPQKGIFSVDFQFCVKLGCQDSRKPLQWMWELRFSSCCQFEHIWCSMCALLQLSTGQMWTQSGHKGLQVSVRGRGMTRPSLTSPFAPNFFRHGLEKTPPHEGQWEKNRGSGVKKVK